MQGSLTRAIAKAMPASRPSRIVGRAAEPKLNTPFASTSGHVRISSMIAQIESQCSRRSIVVLAALSISPALRGAHFGLVAHPGVDPWAAAAQCREDPPKAIAQLAFPWQIFTGDMLQKYSTHTPANQPQQQRTRQRREGEGEAEAPRAKDCKVPSPEEPQALEK